MQILVVGGAGYIGSHMVWRLGQQPGVRVTTLDNLSNGHADAVLAGELVVGDLGDAQLLDQLLGAQQFDAVIHFASSIQVGESVREPLLYYRNNVANTLTLLAAMQRHGVPQLVFSSTAAVYGEPQTALIAESHCVAPINPYGHSKAMVEAVLADCAKAWGLRYAALRYFNAAGAHPDSLLGERHEPETHLLPLVLQAAQGRLPHITVFGDDYATPDGTCVRDYVHVLDLADAHWLALAHLQRGGAGGAFNLGNGNGFSVREVIDTVQRVTGHPVPVQWGARRAGDPAQLVADATLARKVLGWQPHRAGLSTIVRDAWNWECHYVPARAAPR